MKVLSITPKFPVIVISRDKLLAGASLRSLATAISVSIPEEGKSLIQIIDSTGKEFWFELKTELLCPGFFCKKWSKKKIVELFNTSLTVEEAQKVYSTKSLPNKRLATVVLEICEAIGKNGGPKTKGNNGKSEI